VLGEIAEQQRIDRADDAFGIELDARGGCGGRLSRHGQEHGGEAKAHQRRHSGTVDPIHHVVSSFLNRVVGPRSRRPCGKAA
jgi:hypothetical protein